MRYSGRLCNVCGGRNAESLSVKANVAVRVTSDPRSGAGSVRSKQMTVGKIDLCSDCFGRVIEVSEQFPDLDAVRAWKATTKAAIRSEEQLAPER